MNKKGLLAFKWFFVFSLIFIALFNQLDLDFGWHLASGNYVRNRGIPTHDVFTYTAEGFRWINHEMMNDVLMSFLYSFGGYTILVILYSALWTGALLLSAPRARLGILLLGSLAIMPYIAVRPTAWTAFGLAVLLKIISGRSRRLKLAIPLLFLFWANLHGGFIIGLAVLVYYAIRERSKFWAGVLLASTLATFGNIYGPRLYEEILRTLFDPSVHSQIVEWFSFYIFDSSWPFIISWIIGFWLFSRHKLSEWLSLPPLMLLAGFSATRNITLFVVVSLQKTDEYYSMMLKQIPKKPAWLTKLFFWGSTTIIYLAVAFGFYGQFMPWVNDREINYPRTAVAYLKTHGCPGRLFNDYNYGGYLIWKLPEEKVYIDGRMSSWRDESGTKYIDKFFGAMEDSKKQKIEFEKFDVKCVLVRNYYDEFIKRLTDSGWSTAVDANGAHLLTAPRGM